MHGEWVRKPAADAAVIFVHGILSSGETCWRHEAGTYWPHLLRDESEFGDLGIFVFSYETNIFSGSYDISDIVDALKEWLRVDGVMACRRLVFVCHSMGGIVVRKFLVERTSQLIDDGHTVGLYLVASPSLGSSYANWLGPLASLFGHSQAAVLRFIDDNPLLKDVDKTFKNLKEEGKLRLRGKEITEDKFVVFSKFLRKQVVQPFAGAVYFGEPFKVPGSDHFSIAKPASGDAIQHRLLVEFVKTFLRSMDLEDQLPQAPVEDYGRQPSDISSTLAVAAPSRVSQAKSRGVAELLQEVCSKDPYVAIPAAHELAEIEGLTEVIVDRPNHLNEMVPLAAVRIALARREDAADLLAARVLEAERDWHRAVAAAMDFDVSHRPFAAHRLGAELDKRGRDCTRVIMWALGSLGAVEWSYSIRSFLQKQAPSTNSLDDRTDDLRDYVAHALEGLFDIFRLTTSPRDIANVSSVLRDVIRLDEKHSTDGYGALKARLQLASCSGAHIDDLVRHWAGDESARVRGMGADALGDIRAQRTIARLEKLLSDSDHNVRSAASQALGAIETTDALDALMRSAPDSDGISFSIHLLADTQRFSEISSSLLKQPSFFRWAAIRAVGIRRAREFAPRLREFLGCDNELERGCALLALARIGDPNDRARILNGVQEASDSFEKVMAMLALISVAPDLYSTIQVNLRRHLADYSYAFWQPARRDIISVLESTGVDDARMLADYWRPFYSGSGKVPTS